MHWYHFFLNQIINKFHPKINKMICNNILMIYKQKIKIKIARTMFRD